MVQYLLFDYCRQTSDQKQMKYMRLSERLGTMVVPSSCLSKENIVGVSFVVVVVVYCCLYRPADLPQLSLQLLDLMLS